MIDEAQSYFEQHADPQARVYGLGLVHWLRQLVKLVDQQHGGTLPQWHGVYSARLGRTGKPVLREVLK